MTTNNLVPFRSFPCSLVGPEMSLSSYCCRFYWSTLNFGSCVVCLSDPRFLHIPNSS